MDVKKISLNKERNVNLTAFLQKVKGEFVRVNRRPAVLILPGGGYEMCSDIEAEPVAVAYAKAGFQAFVLRYSVGEHNVWPNQLNDYEQAMKMIRENADEWGLYADKIAVIGFSAGGHLASCAATLSENRPDAAILGYAALNQATVDICGPDLPIAIEHVDEETCPCFLFASRDDSLTPVKNTLEFQMALAETNVNFESHIYSFGSHGFSTAEKGVSNVRSCDRVHQWVDDSIGWLKEIFGEFGDGELSKPKFGKRINDDLEKNLSVDSTIPLIMAHADQLGETLDSIAPLLDTSNIGGEKVNGSLDYFRKNIRLRDVLLASGQPGSVIEQLDMVLHQIPNKSALERTK